MSDEKTKKALKLKTFDEIQNDDVYEIHLFPKKRRTQITEDETIEDQVRRSYLTKQSIILFFFVIYIYGFIIFI